MEREDYLQRIKYVGSHNPTLEVLSELQQSHLMTVPFENLYVFNKVKIDLSTTINKIVNQKRGGFCYELNSLFYQLLKELGFVVRMVSARVFNKEKGFGPEFDHMAIIATINNQDYLADVGFGEFSLFPLKVQLNQDQTDPRGIFRMEPYENEYIVVKKKNQDGEFGPEYIFSLQARRLEEFYEMCHYHQTNPESHFTQKRICSLATPEGRITLTGNTFKVTSNGKITETQIESEQEVDQILLNYFQLSKIQLPYDL